MQFAFVLLSTPVCKIHGHRNLKDPASLPHKRALACQAYSCKILYNYFSARTMMPGAFER